MDEKEYLKINVEQFKMEQEIAACHARCYASMEHLEQIQGIMRIYDNYKSPMPADVMEGFLWTIKSLRASITSDARKLAEKNRLPNEVMDLTTFDEPGFE